MRPSCTHHCPLSWADRWKFTTTTSPITVDSAWTWNGANPVPVPYVKEWLAGPLTVDNNKDATMGIVLTQTLDQQDAGGARDPGGGQRHPDVLEQDLREWQCVRGAFFAVRR